MLQLFYSIQSRCWMPTLLSLTLHWNISLKTVTDEQDFCDKFSMPKKCVLVKAVTRALIGGVFIYSCFARLNFFEISCF